jgi:hypothetical protein
MLRWGHGRRYFRFDGSMIIYVNISRISTRIPIEDGGARYQPRRRTDVSNLMLYNNIGFFRVKFIGGRAVSTLIPCSIGSLMVVS